MAAQRTWAAVLAIPRRVIHSRIVHDPLEVGQHLRAGGVLAALDLALDLVQVHLIRRGHKVGVVGRADLGHSHLQLPRKVSALGAAAAAHSFHPDSGPYPEGGPERLGDDALDVGQRPGQHSGAQQLAAVALHAQGGAVGAQPLERPALLHALQRAKNTVGADRLKAWLWMLHSAKVASLGSSRQCLGAGGRLGLPPLMQVLQHVCKICAASTYSSLIKVDETKQHLSNRVDNLDSSSWSEFLT